MQQLKVFYPNELDTIFHQSADGLRTYRLDGIKKFLILKKELDKDPRFQVTTVDAANTDLLTSVHSREYINSLVTGIPKELAESSGLIWKENISQVFSNSAECLFLACNTALMDGKAISLSKGGHHAVKDRGFGFNPINEIAITISKLKSSNQYIKIAVLDLDVHFGNGLHELLRNTDNVIVLDVWNKTHSKWSGFEKAANLHSYNVSNMQEYWSALDSCLELINKSQPDLVIYHSGMDIFEEDRLGGIKGFGIDEIRLREKKVMKEIESPVALVFGGGYSDHSEQSSFTIEDLVKLHAISIDELLNR